MKNPGSRHNVVNIYPERKLSPRSSPMMNEPHMSPMEIDVLRDPMDIKKVDIIDLSPPKDLPESLMQSLKPSMGIASSGSPMNTDYNDDIPFVPGESLQKPVKEAKKGGDAESETDIPQDSLCQNDSIKLSEDLEDGETTVGKKQKKPTKSSKSHQQRKRQKKS